MQSRYYNPDWGRFINADAEGGQIGELLSHNVFAYCGNNPVNMSDPDGNRFSLNDLFQSAKSAISNAINTITQHVVASAVATVIVVAAVVGINYVIKHPRTAAVISGGTAAAMKNVVEKVSGGGQGAASNAVNAVKLNAQLTYQEASSVFTESGTLRPDVVNNSKELISGIKLENTRVIEALTSDGSSINNWAKMTTQVFRSPSGNFQVHFYQNLENGIISIFEMKAKFTR